MSQLQKLFKFMSDETSVAIILVVVELQICVIFEMPVSCTTTYGTKRK